MVDETGKTGHPTRGDKVYGLERQARALQMSVTGYSLKQIKDELGYRSQDHARLDINNALRESKRKRDEAADTYVEQALSRLDSLEGLAHEVIRRRHYALTSKGLVWMGDGDKPLEDDAHVLAAMDRILKIEERRAKITGIDAPTKARVEVHNHDRLDDEIERLIGGMARLGRGEEARPAEGTTAPGLGG